MIESLRVDRRLTSLVGEIAGGHHEGEEERLVVGVGGVVAGRDHRLQVGADAQVVREVSGWNNRSAMGWRALVLGCVKPEITQPLVQPCTNRV